MHRPAPQPDHLVIAAASLDEGVHWCEQVLGITPGPGGAHPLMGTHNRLALIASPHFPKAYLEIIAIDPQATPTKPARQARWFGLDEPGLQQCLQQQGPQLIHWVARLPELDPALNACAAAGLDMGEAVSASRQTAQGPLCWSIAVRADGQLPHAGVMPTLISWGAQHPSQAMEPSGVSLTTLVCQHPQAGRLNQLWHKLGGEPTRFVAGEPGLQVVLKTPRGEVCLGLPPGHPSP